MRGAIEVLGRDGVDALTASAVTAAAGVSNGTFYNYVTGAGEMVAMVADELAGVFDRGIEHLARTSEDPGARVALGMLQVLALPTTDEPYARAFVASVAGNPTFREHVRDRVARTIEAGVQAGTFRVPSIAAATDALVGTGMQTLRTDLRGGGVDPLATVELVLRMLAVDERDISAILERALAAQAPT